MHLFAEIFPLEAAAAQITAYALIHDDDMPTALLPRIGRGLVRRLRKAYPGAWLWRGEASDARLLTNQARSEVELNILLDFARDEDPDLYMFVDTLALDDAYQPTPVAIAEFALRTSLVDLEPALRGALAQFNTQLTTEGDGQPVRVERDYRLTPWTVAGAPALALSISARLVYGQDAQRFAAASADPAAALVGLRAAEPSSRLTGEIVRVTGSAAERRPHMLSLRALRLLPPELHPRIQRAPADEWVVRFRLAERGEGARSEGTTRGGTTRGGKKRRSLELPASLLEPLIRPADFARFGLRPEVANPALRPDPAARAQQVKALSDLAKEAGVLARAYNSREHPALFVVPDAEQPDFQPYLRFKDRRTRPYRLATLADDFRQCGAYHLREAFQGAPLRIAVINALGDRLDDFIEALNRMLTRSFGLTVELLRERRVRVVSLANVAAAVDVVEGEAPAVVLVFLPDQPPQQAEGEDLVAYVKSLTLGRGLPAHVISQTTVDDPESMPGIIMSLLARTGNTPFALADPLEFTDFVVGLDAVRQPSDAGGTTLTAVARIYRSDGIFVRWAVRAMTLSGHEPPYVLLRDLFPQRDFARQRVLIHHEGRMADDVRQALTVWGQALGATFQVVEIVRRGAPRLYAFDDGKIVAPPPGSAFRLSAREAFFVLAHDPDQPTPQPLHVIAAGLGIDQALHSLRMWTLLAYTTAPDGQLVAPLLPVTLAGAGELAYWLRKGNTFTATEGEVPFWL